MKVIIDMPEIDEARAVSEPAERKKLMLELGCVLYQKNLLTFAQARRLAGTDYVEFGRELGNRGIPRHYTEEMLAEDFAYASSHACH
ncbi:MAG: UPF0175 family protein [Prosthecobacter sp.]